MSKRTQTCEEKYGYSFTLNKEKNSLNAQNNPRNLTKIQNQILQKVVYYGKKAHFLSSNDLERMMSYKKDDLDSAITFLRDSGLIKTTRANGILYYCPFNEFKHLMKQKEDIIINDKIESKLIKRVRECVEQLYPNALIEPSEELTGFDRHRGFDIIFEFKLPVQSKQFIVVDVYAKIPVTEYIVQSFIRKIKLNRNGSSSNDESERTSYPLRGRTLGIIVCSYANQKAIDAAHKNEISLLNFRDIYINYDEVRKNFELAG